MKKIDSFAPGRWIYNGWDIAEQGSGYVVWRMPNFRFDVATFDEAAKIAERWGYCA